MKHKLKQLKPERDFNKLMEIVKQFHKPRRYRTYSTAGKWVTQK